MSLTEEQMMPKPEWECTNDTMPPPEQLVLVFYKQSKQMGISLWREKRKKWERGIPRRSTFEGFRDDVSHWQRLPNPPQL